MYKIKGTDAKTVILLVGARVSCFFAFLFHPVSVEAFLIDQIAVGQILLDRHADSRSAACVPATVGRHVGRIVALSVVPLADQS